jgi:hypothetical protein
MNKIILTTLFALGISNVAYSEGFNYDYIQAGIGTSNSKHIDKEYYVTVSKPVNNNFSVKGKFKYSFGDWDDPGEHEEQKINSYYLEGIYNNSIGSSTDLLASLEYLKSNYDLSCVTNAGVDCGSSYSNGTSPSYDYTTAKLGVRHKIDDKLEIEGLYKATKVSGSSSLAKQLKVSATREINTKLSLGLEYDLGIGSVRTDYYGVFIRKNF